MSSESSSALTSSSPKKVLKKLSDPTLRVFGVKNVALAWLVPEKNWTTDKGTLSSNTVPLLDRAAPPAGESGGGGMMGGMGGGKGHDGQHDGRHGSPRGGMGGKGGMGGMMGGMGGGRMSEMMGGMMGGGRMSEMMEGEAWEPGFRTPRPRPSSRP